MLNVTFRLPLCFIAVLSHVRNIHPSTTVTSSLCMLVTTTFRTFSYIDITKCSESDYN